MHDLAQILDHEIKFGEQTLQVNLKATVCEAPTEAMVKATKQFSGHFGCDRCNQRAAG